MKFDTWLKKNDVETVTKRAVAVSKIGWTDEAREAAAEARRRLGAQTRSGKTIPHIDHAVYTEPGRGGVAPHAFGYSEEAAKTLEDRLPDWSKDDHAEAAKHHQAMAKYHHENWLKMVNAETVPGFRGSPGWYEARDYHGDTAMKHASLAEAHKRLSKR